MQEERKYAYYNCITYSKKGKDVCPDHRVRADEFDKEVIKRVKKLVFSEENMKKFVDDINAATKSLRMGYGKKISELKKRATDLQIRLMRQYEAIENGGIDFSLVAERLKELKNQKNDQQEEMANNEGLNTKNQPEHTFKSRIDK